MYHVQGLQPQATWVMMTVDWGPRDVLEGEWLMGRCGYVVALTVVVAVVARVAPGIAHASGRAAVPTFTEDVAPILFEKCVTCHRPGEIAPMSLMSYAETRPWTRSIRNQVNAGTMPPWHADPDVGRFSNERRLTGTEKDTILRWADGGAPEGDPDGLPPVPLFADGWQFGHPDVVLEMPDPFEVPAEGEVAYQYFSTPTNFAEDTWAQAIEVCVGEPSVVHHVLVYVKDPSGSRAKRGFKDIPVDERYKAMIERNRKCAEEARLSAEQPAEREEDPGVLIATMAPGSNPMVFDPATALRIPKGAELVFQVHYTSTGRTTLDRSMVGMILAGAPPTREIRADKFLNPAFELPPGSADERVDTKIEFTEDVEIFALLPHTHLRGKRWEYRLNYPDCRSERVLSVPNYDFDWQTFYVLEKPLAVPRGSTLEASAWHDNSAANRANPDPTVAVTWGEQTWEEMQYTGIYYSVPVSDPRESVSSDQR